jgi:ubiquinone biosynthesis protein COQ4
MSVLRRRGAFELRSLTTKPTVSCTLRPFSVLNRPPPNYPGHVPLTTIERGALAVGSALGSLINPRRAGTELLNEDYNQPAILSLMS